MKKLSGLFVLMTLPVWAMAQSVVQVPGNLPDTNRVNVSAKDGQVTTVSGMFREFSNEDRIIFQNLGANKLMRTEEYEKTFRNPAIESPVNTEVDPK